MVSALMGARYTLQINQSIYLFLASSSEYINDIEMLEFLIDNIFVAVGGQVFQQIVGTTMGTNCAPFVFIRGGIQSKASTQKEKKNLLLWPSNRHFDISTMFYLLTKYVDSIYIAIVVYSVTPQHCTIGR
jgi:hypothetical protein